MSQVIAIDGPAGAGKSTIAKKLANILNYNYLDTGAMYRAVTYSILQNKIDINNKEEIKNLLQNINISILPSKKNEPTKILLNQKEITQEIRKPKINKFVSKVAKIKIIRDKLVRQQRQIGSKNNIILDGRDIGTRVFPEADFKFFLTASLDERAKRRYHEIKDNNPDLTLKQIKHKLKKRDQIDKKRQHSPLVIAEDAIEIDTTKLNINEVLSLILDRLKGE